MDSIQLKNIAVSQTSNTECFKMGKYIFVIFHTYTKVPNFSKLGGGGGHIKVSYFGEHIIFCFFSHQQASKAQVSWRFRTVTARLNINY